MSIEVRNFTPSDEALNVSIYSNIQFDLVGLDGYTIDITSFTIDITTTSNIDEDTHVISYTDSSSEVSYSGNSSYYSFMVNPSVPFDEGLSVTVTINVEGLDEVSAYALMEEFESSFTTSYNGVISDFKYAFIHYAQDIPMYDEQLRCRSTVAPQVFDSALQRWNKSPVPKIEVNQVIVASSDTTYGHTVDYENGLINFTSALDYNDIVKASYHFSFFSDEQIQAFFRQASAVWAMNPPTGGPFSIYNASNMLQGVLMIGASTFAFRELLMSLAFQEKRIIFDNASGGEGWTQIKDLFKSLFDSYQDDWKSLLEAKKVRLPNIAAVISPSYTMPGGRSRMFRYLYKGGNG